MTAEDRVRRYADCPGAAECAYHQPWVNRGIAAVLQATEDGEAWDRLTAERNQLRGALREAYEKHEPDLGGECPTCLSHNSETYTAWQSWPCSTAIAIADSLDLPTCGDLQEANQRIRAALAGGS